MAVAPVSAKDLAYIQGHPRATVRGQRPRLAAVKQNQAKAMPVCTVAPAITGTPTVGQLQTCTAGTWLNSPTMAYRWRRRGVGDIIGATGSTYTLTATDSGYQVECEVTASNGVGSVVAKSNVITVP